MIDKKKCITELFFLRANSPIHIKAWCLYFILSSSDKIKRKAIRVLSFKLDYRYDDIIQKVYFSSNLWIAAFLCTY